MVGNSYSPNDNSFSLFYIIQFFIYLGNAFFQEHEWESYETKIRVETMFFIEENIFEGFSILEPHGLVR